MSRSGPRPFKLRTWNGPTAKSVEQWYRAQHRSVLGPEAKPAAHAVASRCFYILKYLAETRIPLESLRMVVTNDGRWADRDGRTDLEASAVRLGQTVRGGRRQVFWLAPVAPEEAGDGSTHPS